MKVTSYSRFAALLGLVVFLSADANAASINVQFQGSGDGNTPALAPTDFAGVVPQSNYNVFAGTLAAGPTALNNNLGVPSGASMTTSTWNAIWHATPTIPAGTDEILNRGGVYSLVGDAQGANDITVSSVPFALYDVYVYTLYDAPGNTVNVALTPTSGSGGGVFYGTNPNAGAAGYVDGNINTPFTYTQALGTTFGTATPNATYFKFSNLTASEFSFSVSQVSGGNPAVDGFQIVQVEVPPAPIPEPSSMILLGCGIVGLSAMRRRSRSKSAARA